MGISDLRFVPRLLPRALGLSFFATWVLLMLSWSNVDERSTWLLAVPSGALMLGLCALGVLCLVRIDLRRDPHGWTMIWFLGMCALTALLALLLNPFTADHASALDMALWSMFGNFALVSVIPLWLAGALPVVFLLSHVYAGPHGVRDWWRKAVFLTTGILGALLLYGGGILMLSFAYGG